MMIESYKCSLCNLEFRTIDQMSGYWRLDHHQNVEHLAECMKCDMKFTSYSHATVHLYQTHDVRCVRCGDCCEGLCLKDTIKKLEKTHNNEKEEMMLRIEKRISEEEERYINSFEGVSEYHMEKLKYIIHALDEGFTGCLANSYGMLTYLPFMEVSQKQGRLSRFGRKLVERHQYLSAMVKLNLYLTYIQQIYEGSLSTIIPRYIEDCEKLNNENETVELTPEMLIDTKLCFPERFIGGPDPNEWTDSLYIKRYGVPDRLTTENEPLTVRVNPSNQQEVTIQEMMANVNDINMKRITQSKDLFNYLSYSNTEEEHPRMIRTLNSVESLQQKTEAMNTNYIRMKFDHANGDSVVEEYSTYVPAGGIIETLNTDFSDVTEGMDNNVEYLLGMGIKSSDNHMQISESPVEVVITENSNGRSINENLYYTQVPAKENIKITNSSIKNDNHEEKDEITSNFVTDANIFDSESLLEEYDIDEWLIKTESNLLIDMTRVEIEGIENEQSAGLTHEYERKDKVSTRKEVGDSYDMNNSVEDNNANNKPDNNDTKVTDVLERTSSMDPETAKKGTTIRVLWAPETADS